jgi:hypothetical protein
MSQQPSGFYGAGVQFAVLGPLEVNGGRDPIEIASAKERAVLARPTSACGARSAFGPRCPSVE